MKRASLILVILIILTSIIPLAQCDQSENYETLETKYFILKAPPEKLAKIKKDLIDKIYEIELSLLGVPPLGENKIVVEYSEKGSVADCETKRILIHERTWDYEESFCIVLAHEVAHIFTSTQKNKEIISPGLYEGFIAISEGWAYLLQDVTTVILLKNGDENEYNERMVVYRSLVEKYEKEIRDFNELKPYANAYIFGGMLLTYVEKYSWDAMRRFFKLVTSIEIPFPVDSFSALVWTMGVAAGDLEGVYSMFRDRWCFPVRTEFFLINVSVTNFKGEYYYLYFNGKKTEKLTKSNVYLLAPDNLTHSVFIYPWVVMISSGERWICKNNSYIVQNSTELLFNYTLQYYLKVEGEKEEKDGWYDAGIEVNVSVPQLTEFNNGTRESFKGFFDEKGELITKENSIVIIMDAPKALKVEWDKEYYLKVESEYGLAKGGGWYKIGKEITISISEAIIDYGNSTRRKFSGWYENDKLIGEEPTLTVTVDRPKTIIAKWETEFEVKIISEMGNINGSGWYKAGSCITVEISPIKIQMDFFHDYVFRGWKINGSLASTSPSCSFIVDKPITLIANWTSELNLFNVGAVIIGILSLVGSIALIQYIKKHNKI